MIWKEMCNNTNNSKNRRKNRPNKHPSNNSYIEILLVVFILFFFLLIMHKTVSYVWLMFKFIFLHMDETKVEKHHNCCTQMPFDFLKTYFMTLYALFDAIGHDAFSFSYMNRQNFFVHNVSHIYFPCAIFMLLKY